MRAITKEQEVVTVEAQKWTYPHTVQVNVDKAFIKETGGMIVMQLTKKQATKFANALRAQRDRIKGK